MSATYLIKKFTSIEVIFNCFFKRNEGESVVSKQTKKNYRVLHVQPDTNRSQYNYNWSVLVPRKPHSNTLDERT